MASGADQSLTLTEWFSAAELEELALPSLPMTKRQINRRAQDECWTLRKDKDGAPLARKRGGRGGGLEFHISLLPAKTRLELVERGLCAADPADAEQERAASWSWFDRQSGKVKSEAKKRLRIINEIEVMERSGQTISSVIAAVSENSGIACATLWNWRSMVSGVAAPDRLPALAPRRVGGGKASVIDPDMWQMYKSDRLRPSQPPASTVYRRVAAAAKELGIHIPSARAFDRKFKRDVPKAVEVFMREGEEAARRSLPALRRTVEHFTALEAVNLDGHQFDVFVAEGEGKKFRPTMVAIQDVRSSKILAWRLDKSENTLITRLCFADLFRNFGIPRFCLTDNGRAFASKELTGGAKTRFRGKIHDDDPTGVLTSLGVEVKWATPGRGQSKPIERAFRDIANSVSRAPFTDGAYTGNSPVNKPHDYGKRAVPFAEFEKHVAQGVAAHNAQQGRRGRDYNGRSFDQVFNELYAANPVAKATPEQLRLALLSFEQKMVNRQTGEINLLGNRYWSPACNELHGQKVTVRFDPEYLFDDIHLYGLDGAYLASIPLYADAMFDNAADARRAKKLEADHKRMLRDAVNAQNLLDAAELAAMQAKHIVPDTPEPGATRMVHHRSNAAALRKPQEAAPMPRHRTDTHPAKPEAATVMERMRKGAELYLVEDQK